jgi:hypothetical protein
MRRLGLLLGIGLLFACGASAQVNPESSLLLWPPDPAMAPVAPATDAPPAPAAAAPSAPVVERADLASASVPSEPAQGVQAPLSEYYWQIYIGYSFLRFYELPKSTVNTNGLNISLERYFPSINWLGLDGEFTGTYGSFPCSKFAMGMGGARMRLDAWHGIELWAHGMVGGAHFLPQTSFGGQGAFAYQVGGGADFTVHFQRIGFRVAGDMVGTRFFSTNQESPKISVGIVYRF